MQNLKFPAYTIYNDPVFVKFIANYFGWEYRIIRIVNGDIIIACIPFIKRGSKWISLPFASVLGLGEVLNYIDKTDLPHFFSYLFEKVNDDNCHNTHTLQVVELSHQLTGRQSVSIPLEFRSFIGFTNNPYADKVLSLLSLNGNIKDQFAFFSGNLRRKVRKAVKNKISVQSGGIELIDDFYLIYSRNCHRLGSPIPGKEFYRELINSYGPGNAEIFVAYLGKRPVGTSILIAYREFWENIYFATNTRFNHLYPSYLLHWEMISYAIVRDAKIYSFGRSTLNSGVHNYKKQWNTTDFPLYWNNFSGEFIRLRKLKILAKVWSIMPTVVVKKLGPYLAAKIN